MKMTQRLKHPKRASRKVAGPLAAFSTLLLAASAQAQDSFQGMSLQDKAEVRILKSAPVKKEAKTHRLSFSKGKQDFVLTEIPYFEHYDIADGLDFDSLGNPWIVSARHNREVMIDAKTLEITEYQLPRGIGCRILVIDDEGVHWVAAQLAQSILESYPHRQSAIVHKPNAAAWMNYLAVDGKNDVVWYSMPGLNVLGKYDRRGAFSAYEIPTFDAGPGGLDVDPQGNVWIAEVYGNKVAKFSPAERKFTEYELPTESALPFAVMIDSQGNAWVGEHNTDKLALFKDGNFKEYPLPNSNSGINSLDEAPDRSIWFAEGGWRGNMNGNRVGRLDPKTGRVDEVALPTANSQPQSLKVAPNGDVWFIEMGTGHVARLKAVAAQSAADGSK